MATRLRRRPLRPTGRQCRVPQLLFLRATALHRRPPSIAGTTALSVQARTTSLLRPGVSASARVSTGLAIDSR